MVKEAIAIEIDLIEKQVNQKLIQVKQNVRKLAVQLHPFRMELLGVVFAAAAVQRVLTGLLNPAMQLIDAFVGWTTGLQLLFLPAAQDVQQWGLDFLDTVLKIDPAMQTIINKVTELGFAIVILIGTFAAFGLGYNAFLASIAGWAAFLAGVAGLINPWTIGILLFVGALMVLDKWAKQLTGNSIFSKEFWGDALYGITDQLTIWKDDFFKKWDEFEDLLPAPIKAASEFLRTNLSNWFDSTIKFIDNILAKLGFIDKINTSGELLKSIGTEKATFKPGGLYTIPETGHGAATFNAYVNVTATSSLDVSAVVDTVNNKFKEGYDGLFRSR